MANKQTLPGMVDTQKRYVQADTSPQIPQISWKSPLRDVSNLMNETNEFAETYSKLRYDEYEAKYNNMATQMFHEMDDATDPCQLQEIKNKYDTEFNKPLDNTVWAKSYNNSRYKRSWTDDMNLNYEKKYIQKMHEFTAIQLDRTLNEMSSAAALTGDVRSAASFFDSGINAIGNTKHMNIEVRDKMQKQFATDFIGKLYTRDPNFALSFVNQAESGLAKYGIDVNKIRRDAENWNLSKQREAREKERQERIYLENIEKAQASYLTMQIRQGLKQRSDALQEASLISPNVYNTVFEKTKPANTSSTRDVSIFTKRILNSSDPEEEKKKIYSEYSDLSSTERNTIDAYVNILKNDENVSDDDIIYIDDLKNGRVWASTEELSNKFSGETLEKALEARTAGEKIISSRLKEKETQLSNEEKDKSSALLLEAREKLMSAETLQEKISIYEEYSPQLNSSDASNLFTEFKNDYSKLSENITNEQKEEFKKQYENMHNAEYQTIYKSITENPDIYNEEDFRKWAESGRFSQTEIKEFRDLKSTTKEKNTQAQIQINNDTIRFKASLAWERGDTVDPNEYANSLTNVDRQTAIKEAQDANKSVMEERYKKSMNALTLSIYSQNMDLTDLQERSLNIASAYGKDYNTVYESAKKIWDTKEKDRTGMITSAVNKINQLWGSPVYGKETKIEADAKNTLLDYVQAQALQLMSENKDISAFLSDDNLQKLVYTYKPTSSTVLKAFEGFRLSKAALDVSRERFSTYDKDLKKWVPNNNFDPAETFAYRAQVQAALNNQVISPEDYASYMGIADDSLIATIDEYQKKPDTVLGYSIKYFKEKYFKGDNIDYPVMSNLINQTLSLLGEYGIGYDNNVNDSWFYKNLGWGSSKEEDRNIIDKSLENVLKFNLQPSDADAVISGNNIIVL